MMLLGSREAFALGLVAVGFRLFYTIFVDNPQSLNSGWILALAAAAAILPMAFVLRFLGKSYKESPAMHLKGAPQRVIFAVVAIFAVFDAAGSTSLFSHSASYMALDDIPTLYIRLTCVIAAGLGCLGGVDAIGSTARVWLRLLFWLLLIVVVSVLSILNPYYLRPILGPGVKTLSQPVWAAAGIVSSLLPLWLLREKPKNDLRRFGVVSLCANIGIVVAALLALAGMMLPPMLNVPTNRTFQLDRLLANGRVSVLLQLPMLFIWFGCYIASLSYSLVFAVHSLTICIPAIPRPVATSVCAALAFALTFTDVTKTSILAQASVVKLAVYYFITAALVVWHVAEKKRSANA